MIRKRKDWAHSQIYNQTVLLNEETPSQTDLNALKEDEAEYLSKILLNKLAMNNQTPEPREMKNDDADKEFAKVWSKAIATEKLLQEELASYKRLPKDVTKY